MMAVALQDLEVDCTTTISGERLWLVIIVVVLVILASKGCL